MDGADRFSEIQPIVLVGGRSRRFGRDKLREPLGDGWLVDRPIGALRGVFGGRVAVVGACEPEVAGRADLVIADRYPGVGPVGGILSALEATAGDVFVLAGDLAGITSASVRAILVASNRSPEAWAVLGEAGRIEPCIGLYRAGCLELLRGRIGAGRGASLWDLVPRERLALVAIAPEEAANINTPDQLGGSGRD